MTTYSHFVDGFLLPALAALFAGGVVAVFFGGLRWSIKKHLWVTLPILVLAFVASWLITMSSKPEHVLTVAGTVVDETTNQPVAQALVGLADGSKHDLSEDNGNFRLDLAGTISKVARVRIRVTKNGYSPFDGTVEVPTEGFVIRLRHL